MKLPKGFGGQGFGSMMDNMKQAMDRAKDLETELANDRVTVEQEFVTATFDGRAELVSISIKPELVDPEDTEGLESAIVAAIRAGFERANSLREAKTKEIMAGMPDIPGLT